MTTEEKGQPESNKHSAGFSKAAKAFADQPSAKAKDDLDVELSKGTYESDDVMRAQLLEAIGPDAYNNYVHTGL